MAESIIRLEGRRDFTVLSNGILRDKRVSLKTKGLYAVMLSRPGNWQFSISGLAAFTGAGRDAIRSALKELRKAGYLTLGKQSHDDGGKFSGSVYVLHEETVSPCADYPHTAEPTTAEPTTENPTQINIDLINTDSSNTPHTPQGGRRDRPKKKTELASDVKAELRRYVGDDRELAQSLADLIEVRTALKAVNSLRAIQTLLRELDRLSEGRRVDKLLLLRQSVTNSWKSVFPLRGGTTAASNGPARTVESGVVPEW